MANAIKQRDQILEQIAAISDYASFLDFFENYKSRLTRINDRENQIFMKSLLARLNNTKNFLTAGKLSPEEKLDIIETLLNHSQLFARGTTQYHVPLEISEKYFYGIKDKEILYSLINSCRVQVDGQRENAKKDIDEDYLDQ